jgi:hypothetical protein
MVTDAPPVLQDTPPTASLTPSHWTTRRAMAMWSFCIGLWSTLVFWWYPYSIFVATVGLVLGSLSILMGWKAGRDGENYAIGGVLLCSNTVGLAFIVYRGMQLWFGDLSWPVFP